MDHNTRQLIVVEIELCGKVIIICLVYFLYWMTTSILDKWKLASEWLIGLFMTCPLRYYPFWVGISNWDCFYENNDCIEVLMKKLSYSIIDCKGYLRSLPRSFQKWVNHDSWVFMFVHVIHNVFLDCKNLWALNRYYQLLNIIKGV